MQGVLSRRSLPKWKEVYDRVIDGVSLADAMALSPTVFPRVYTAMVQAGETGGFLDVVLGQIADFQAREKELKAKVMTALLYPVILLTLALGVLTFLMVFFIPQFQKIFAGFGAHLPMITQVIVGASYIVRSYGLYVVVVAGVAIYAIRNWFRSPQGSRVWEQLVFAFSGGGVLDGQVRHGPFLPHVGHLAGSWRAFDRISSSGKKITGKPNVNRCSV